MNQIIILTLPNSGSDWFAPMLADAAGLKYQKEFFNPICNTLYRQQLQQVFGCEMVSCYRNIGIPWQRQQRELDRVFAQTWCRESNNIRCTKDVYGFRKVGWFAKHFNVIILHRSAELSLPPSRLRAQVWYDAIYSAINHEAYEPWCSTSTTTELSLQDRVLEAHAIASAELLSEAAALALPVVDMSDLLNHSVSDLADYLGTRIHSFGVDVNRLAAQVAATRRVPSSDRFW